MKKKDVAKKMTHAELVRRFKRNEVSGSEVFESAMRNKIKPKGPGARVRLPSGKVLTGKKAQDIADSIPY